MIGHCHVVDFNKLKTMETETKKWSPSPTRVSNYRALTGKILVFLTGGRINRFDCTKYTFTALMKWDLTTR